MWDGVAVGALREQNALHPFWVGIDRVVPVEERTEFGEGTIYCFHQRVRD